MASMKIKKNDTTDVKPIENKMLVKLLLILGLADFEE